MKLSKTKTVVIIMAIAYAILISLWTWKLVTFCYDAVSAVNDDQIQRCVHASTAGTPIIAFVTVSMVIVFILMTMRRRDQNA